MTDIDLDEYESKAAWLEYCDGMARFEAETEAARRQGKSRYEFVAFQKQVAKNKRASGASTP